MEEVGFCKVSLESLASSFDYEFLNSDTNELKAYLKSAKKAISKLKDIDYLYFREFDDGCFIEVITGRSFKPKYIEEIDKVYYCNKESGLYLIPKGMLRCYKKEAEHGIYDKEYTKNVNKFFDSFISIEKKDSELVSKAHKMLLLENKEIVE